MPNRSVYNPYSSNPRELLNVWLGGPGEVIGHRQVSRRSTEAGASILKNRISGQATIASGLYRGDSSLSTSVLRHAAEENQAMW